MILPLLMGFLKKFMSGKGTDVAGLAGMLEGGDEGGGCFSKLKGLFGG